MFWIQVPYQIHNLEIFYPILLGYLLSFLIASFFSAKVFNFYEVQFLNFFSFVAVLWYCIQKCLA